MIRETEHVPLECRLRATVRRRHVGFISHATNLDAKGSTNNNDGNPIATRAVQVPTINTYVFSPLSWASVLPLAETLCYHCYHLTAFAVGSIVGQNGGL